MDVAVGCSQGGVVTLPAKSETVKSCIFNAFHKHFPCPHALVTLISLRPSPSVYPVATARAPIRRTMPPNSRLVRWLSASSSQ
jgi:hypothetical protein